MEEPEIYPELEAYLHILRLKNELGSDDKRNFFIAGQILRYIRDYNKLVPKEDQHPLRTREISDLEITCLRTRRDFERERTFPKRRAPTSAQNPYDGCIEIYRKDSEHS